MHRCSSGVWLENSGMDFVLAIPLTTDPFSGPEGTISV